jgi:hypothetical protein
MRKLLVALIVTGVLLLGAGLTGLFLTDDDREIREDEYTWKN